MADVIRHPGARSRALLHGLKKLQQYTMVSRRSGGHLGKSLLHYRRLISTSTQSRARALGITMMPAHPLQARCT
jgi:hypothetical protein